MVLWFLLQPGQLFIQARELFIGARDLVVGVHEPFIRTRDHDICIPSRAISRDHARLVVSARSVTVIDMHSANGCFVNDEPVKRHKLRESDVLRIGDRSYRFASDV